MSEAPTSPLDSITSEDDQWLAVRHSGRWHLLRNMGNEEWWNWEIRVNDTGQEPEEALAQLIGEHQAIKRRN